MINATSLALNAAGIIASVSPLAPFLRNITFFDQEKYLENAAEIAKGDFFIDRAVTAVGTGLTNGAKIFEGVPFYRSGLLRYGCEKSSRLCEHPIESGAKIADHKIFEPIAFSCAMAMPEFLGGTVVDQLNECYYDSRKIIVQCSVGVFFNMILAEMPTNVTPENASRPVFDLRFREVVIVEPEMSGFDSNNLLNPSNSNTKKKSVLSDVITSAELGSQILGKLSAF